MSLAAAAGSGWSTITTETALKQLNLYCNHFRCAPNTHSGRKGARKLWFHAGFIWILRPQLLQKDTSFINTVWKMQGLLLESMRNDCFHTVDTSLPSEWDGEELMLLVHSRGRCHQATDAGSARLLYVRLQHS